MKKIFGFKRELFYTKTSAKELRLGKICWGSLKDTA